MTEPITIDHIVGANIVALRHRMAAYQGKRMTQDELRLSLKAEGLVWNRVTLMKAEAGQRSCRVNEILALSKVFQVPIDYFFVPTPELADEVVTFGDGAAQPAWELVAERIATPEGDPDHNLELRAKMLVVDILRDRGYTQAVKGIEDAVNRAMIASAQNMSAIVNKESIGA